MPLVLAPDSIVAEAAHWTLAVNRNQNLLGKVLLVARRPVESVTELDTDEWFDLRQQVRCVCAALDELFRPDQYNHAFLMNLDAQVHLHVVPRYREQRVWDGQVFSDPHFGGLFGTEQRILAARDLARLAGAVRDALAGTPPTEEMVRGS